MLLGYPKISRSDVTWIQTSSLFSFVGVDIRVLDNDNICKTNAKIQEMVARLSTRE